MSDQRIPISQLSETQTAPDASYIAIDDGSLTKKITVENFNSTSTASAQQYATQAAASAQTVEDNIATSAAQIREATLAAREATQASTAATASATSAYDSASLAQNYSVNAATSAGQAMSAADSASQAITESRSHAQDSEAWAVGKRNGSDVPTSDETYQNNAKYYASNASGSATRAEAAAQSITVPDTTLTVSGVAADSKVVGDRISAADAELADIRVKADGTTAATAGDAVREQVGDLKSAIERTIGTDLAEELFPASLKNNGADIIATNCTASILGDVFSFTATRNTELIFGAVATTQGTSYADKMGPKIPLTEGQTINVSLDPAFKKNYVTFFGSDNKSLSWRSFSENDFAFTAPADTAYVVLRIGVQPVTTGTVYSTKIVVLRPYKSIVDTTAAKYTQYAVFTDDLVNALGFVVGGIDSDGNIYTGQKYRVSTNPILCFEKPFKVIVPSGMAIGYREYNPSATWHGWYQTAGESFTIPANTKFRLQTRREPQDTSEVVTDASAFVADFTFEIVSNISALSDRVSALEVGLPSYYYENDWLDDKIEEIHNACSFLNGVAIPFITDLHFGSNSLNSKYLLKEVLDKTACSLIIGGGDYASMYGTQEKLDEEYQTLLDYTGYVGHENWFSMLGNHDFYNAVSSSDSTRHSYTWGKTYNGIFRNSERWQIKPSVKNGYYCIDNDAQKTRLIILNSCEPADATSDYVVNGAARVNNAQLQYLYDRITELSEYNIVVFSHIASDSTMTSYTSDMSPIQTMLEAFANKTSFSVRRSSGGSDITGNFADTSNELICHISGHSHRDESHVSNGVLSIATTCDAHYPDDGHGATAGTVTEQAFDVFCFDYDAGTINAVRVGRGASRAWEKANGVWTQIA